MLNIFKRKTRPPATPEPVVPPGMGRFYEFRRAQEAVAHMEDAVRAWRDVERKGWPQEDTLLVLARVERAAAQAGAVLDPAYIPKIRGRYIVKTD